MWTMMETIMMKTYDIMMKKIVNHAIFDNCGWTAGDMEMRIGKDEYKLSAFFIKFIVRHITLEYKISLSTVDGLVVIYGPTRYNVNEQKVIDMKDTDEKKIIDTIISMCNRTLKDYGIEV